MATGAPGALLTFVTLVFTGRRHRGPDLSGLTKGSPLDLLFDLFHQQRLTAAEPPGAWRGPGASFAGLHGPVELQRAAQEGAHAFGPHVQDGVRVAHLFQVPAGRQNQQGSGVSWLLSIRWGLMQTGTGFLEKQPKTTRLYFK